MTAATPTIQDQDFQFSVAVAATLTFVDWVVPPGVSAIYALIAQGPHATEDSRPFDNMAWNGQTFDFVGKTEGPVTWATVHIYRLLNPTPDTANAVATWQNTTQQICCLLLNIAGANTAIAGTYTGGNGTDGGSTPRRVADIPSQAGDLILGVYIDDEGSGGGLSVESGGSEIQEQENLNSDSDAGWQAKVATGATTTIGWISSNGNNGDWAAGAIAIRGVDGPPRGLRRRGGRSRPASRAFDLKGWFDSLLNIEGWFDRATPPSATDGITEAAFSSAGVGASSLVGASIATTAHSISGAATVTPTGATVIPGETAVAGTASVSAVSGTLFQGSAASVGAATASFVGTSVLASEHAIAGSGQVSATSSATAGSEASSSGVAAVSGVGAAIASSELAAVGSGQCTGTGSAISGSAAAAAGVAAVNGSSAAVATTVYGIAGEAAFAGVGEDGSAPAGEATFTIAGAGSVAFLGAAHALSTAQATGAAATSLAGATVAASTHAITAAGQLSALGESRSAAAFAIAATGQLTGVGCARVLTEFIAAGSAIVLFEGLVPIAPPAGLGPPLRRTETQRPGLEQTARADSMQGVRPTSGGTQRPRGSNTRRG